MKKVTNYNDPAQHLKNFGLRLSMPQALVSPRDDSKLRTSELENTIS